MLGVAGACAMSLGYLNPYWLLSYCYLGTFLFYLAHWQAYVTGRMRFGKIDATEAQFTMMSVMLFSGIFGTQAWGTQVIFYQRKRKLWSKTTFKNNIKPNFQRLGYFLGS